MKMHRVPKHGWVREMCKVKLLGHIFEELILDDQDKFLIDMLKGINFVMHLNQNGLCRHFPIHAVWFIRVFGIVWSWNPYLTQKPLPFWPYCTSCVQCLDFDADKILNLSISNGN